MLAYMEIYMKKCVLQLTPHYFVPYIIKINMLSELEPISFGGGIQFFFTYGPGANLLRHWLQVSIS